jgi:hypothetical protein
MNFVVPNSVICKLSCYRDFTGFEFICNCCFGCIGYAASSRRVMGRIQQAVVVAMLNVLSQHFLGEIAEILLRIFRIPYFWTKNYTVQSAATFSEMF